MIILKILGVLLQIAIVAFLTILISTFAFAKCVCKVNKKEFGEKLREELLADDKYIDVVDGITDFCLGWLDVEEEDDDEDEEEQPKTRQILNEKKK